MQMAYYIGKIRVPLVGPCMTYVIFKDMNSRIFRQIWGWASHNKNVKNFRHLKKPSVPLDRPTLSNGHGSIAVQVQGPFLVTGDEVRWGSKLDRLVKKYL